MATDTDPYQKLSETEVHDLLPSPNEWSIGSEDGIAVLQRTFRFNDFISAFGFVAKIVAIAEKHDHHPRITLSYGAVSVEWWTHSSGGISRKDVEMARLTDTL